MSEELMTMIERLVQDAYGTQGLEYLRQRTRPAPAVQVPDGVEAALKEAWKCFVLLDTMPDASKGFIDLMRHNRKLMADALAMLAAAPTPAPVPSAALPSSHNCDFHRDLTGRCLACALTKAPAPVVPLSGWRPATNAETTGHPVPPMGVALPMPEYHYQQPHIPAESVRQPAPVATEAVAQECFTHTAQADGVQVVPKAMYDQLMSNYIALRKKQQPQFKASTLDRTALLLATERIATPSNGAMAQGGGVDALADCMTHGVGVTRVSLVGDDILTEVISPSDFMEPADPELEAAAKLLWNRFAPNHAADWDSEVHKAEYIDAAKGIRALLASPAPAGTVGDGDAYERAIALRKRICKAAGLGILDRRCEDVEAILMEALHG